MNEIDAELIDAATTARARAYAPYSDFHMGAAIRCADRTIVPGALVENVSLGLALALVSERTAGELTFPCGACLQVALELAGPELIIIAAEPHGQSVQVLLGDLLPGAPHRRTYAPAG